MRRFTFSAAGGLKLTGYLWGNRTGSILILVHGYGEHARRYGAFATWLTKHGIGVAAFDLRGHGESPGPRGHIASFREYLDDLDAFMGVIRRRLRDARLFLLGHSLGGLIVARYLEERSASVEGAVLSAPALAFAISIPSWKRILARIASALAPRLSFPSGIDPAALSHDPEVVEAYRRDPLVHRLATARWFTETLRTQGKTLREAHRIRVPLLVIYGTADRLVSQEAIKHFFAKCGSREKLLKAYENFYHEPINEVGKMEVWGEILRWLRGFP